MGLSVTLVDSGGQELKQPELVGTRWRYAAAANGISNTTTAVAVKAAPGAGARNYVTQLDIATNGAFTNATEFVIRDASAGHVLFRTYIPTTGLPAGRCITFPVPLQGGSNVGLEIATLTASGTGAVYANLAGFSAED